MRNRRARWLMKRQSTGEGHGLQRVGFDPSTHPGRYNPLMATRRRTLSRRVRTRRLVAAGILLVVGFVLLFLVIDALVFWGRVHTGVQIAGYDMGHLTRQQAENRLAELVEQAAAAPVVVVAGDREWPVLPAAFGVVVDVEGTVANALRVTRGHGLVGDAMTRIGSYFSKRSVDLNGRINAEAVDLFIADIAGQLDSPAVNPTLEFLGAAVTVKDGAPGRVVDGPDLKARLVETLLSLHNTRVEVPMADVLPEVTAAGAEAAVLEAQVMISSPVVLTAGDKKWRMTGQEIQAAIDCVVQGQGEAARLMAVISSAKAKEFFQAVAEEVAIPVFNATWETDGKKAVLLEASSGRELDVGKTAVALTNAAKNPTNRVAEAVVAEVKPDRSTEKAASMGIESAIGSFRTEFEGTANRIANIARAAELINGTLLAPGEEFSFNHVVGERTEDRGFHVAKVVAPDGTLQDDLGGGICQVATTIFNAAFFAGLEITERKNHSLYFDTYPKGRDATVSWDGPDLRFLNDTGHWILIKAAATKTSLLFVIYGTPDGRTVSYSTSDWYEVEPQGVREERTDELAAGQTRIKDKGQDGRSCSVAWVVKSADGTVLRERVFESRYPMYNKIVEVGTKQ